MIDKSDNEVLEELRKQTALFQRATKINLIVSVILGILFVLAVVIFPLAYRTRIAYKGVPQVKDSWEQARCLLDKGDFGLGMEMTQRLIRKNPEYYYGYALLGSVYHETGDLKKAEENYARAFELFPIDDNEKTLKAIRRAMERKQK